MLHNLIINILVMPVWSATVSLRGQWSSIQAICNFFWFLPLWLVPGLILAAPIAFGFVGLATGHTSNARKRLLLTIVGSFIYVLLAGIMEYVSEIGLNVNAEEKFYGVFLAFATVLRPHTAFGAFGFWLPTIVCGTYTTLAKRPKWWIASLLGTAVLILGVWLWILLGMLVGAETD